MDKRYQVFVSSTYVDLKEERRRVIQTVIEMDCIPAGMELFPAADEEQFQFIKRVIDDCDYYLLIVGGRYGSTTAEGISYTEKEYDYAVEKGLKVIALIHGSPDDIPLGKSEKDPMLRDKLEGFRKKVSTGRMVKFWKSADELPGLVALSLAFTIKTYPAIGWIRANKAASEDLLAEINDLRKLNTQLLAIVRETKPAIGNLAGLKDSVNLNGTYQSRALHSTWPWTATLTWGDIFGAISPYMVRLPTDEFVKSIVTSTGFARSTGSGDGDELTLNDQEFRTIGVQFQALGLVKLQYSKTTAGGMGLFWSLTSAGERTMIELRTVKAKS
jgi:uncharacterized protein DUF4062